MNEFLTSLSTILTDNILVVLLLAAAVYFTFITRGVQFTMLGEMVRLLVRSGTRDNDRRDGDTDSHHAISSFQAFMVSIASRVGTGNLAGVATAIAVGGPGAVFWMWVIALLGGASSFIESTLAQLFKVRGEKSFRGGPAYYILKGIGCRWWAMLFAVLISVTFGFAYNSVQANTISQAFEVSFGVPPVITGVTLTVMFLLVVWGGIHGIARFSEWVVPVMAVLYILLALFVIVTNLDRIPHVFGMIVKGAFGFGPALGGTVGAALSMGIKRGLFSNEAGEGSAPNVAATASVSHPVKQGLIQALGVFTDTLLICSATAFIILCSGAWTEGYDGIALTQQALDSELPGGAAVGSVFVSVAIFFFAFTSIVANYYYGETNIMFMTPRRGYITAYRLAVGGMVFMGSMSTLGVVWTMADVTMALMTLCNLAAIVVLGRYAVRCLADYRSQRRKGLDPVYRSSTIPEIASKTECWK